MAFVKVCSVVVTKMKGNTWFPSPPVALGDVESHLQQLVDAEKHAHKGPVGAAEERNVELGVVRTDMRLLVAYVQAVSDSNIGSGPAIIESAGLSVAKSRGRAKDPFSVKHGKVPGRVRLSVKAIGRGTYYWQMSLDQEHWSSLPETNQSRTTVDGLTAGTRYYFRFRTLSRNGLSEWSMAIGIFAS
jgi:hypothetical protein